MSNVTVIFHRLHILVLWRVLSQVCLLQFLLLLSDLLFVEIAMSSFLVMLLEIV